ncbi:MAG: efflux RND transporter periplasmic adaptor subunit [Pseudomonadota bacterium]
MLPVKRWIAVCGLTLLPAIAAAQSWHEVRTEDRPITISASGVIAPSEGLLFGPPPSQSWRIAITKIAREGTRVAEGDVLAEFDGSASDDRVKSKQAQLNAKRSELTSLLETLAREVEEDKVRIAAAESDADKAARKAAVDPTVYAGLEYRKLIEERAFTGDTLQREQRRAGLVAKVRDSRLAELEADVRRLESELRAAQAELESFTIRAPRAGLVVVGTGNDGQKLDVNESVNPGMTVVELVDDTVLVVKADIPEFAAARLKNGQSATVTIEAAGGAELKGVVSEISSIVRRQSRFSQAMVRGVTIELAEAAKVELRPGMSTKVDVTVDTVADAIAIPTEALRYKAGEPGVKTRSGWQSVKLGNTSAGMRIVTAGLRDGMEIEW